MARVQLAWFFTAALSALPWVSNPSAAQADRSGCEESAEARLWVSPLHPKPGDPARIMAVATDQAIDELLLSNEQGPKLPIRGKQLGGPPWSLTADLGGLEAGHYRIEARSGGATVSCRPFTVEDDGHGREQALNWSLATEAFYSAWIENLFDAPPEENLAFPSLEPVLRDPRRNFLHNYLGLGEDRNLPATPDCADLPYTLRAYFAWKVGLPVAFRACSRGSAQTPPRCGPANVSTDFTQGIVAAGGFKAISNQLANGVHSGSARTGLDDEASDLYPVELDRETLWPGTVYADPYGHVLILAQWLPQTASRPGLLLAVDAQPDNSVTRKRVWEGTFLFANVASAGPGFKAFRPLVRSAGSGVRPLSNGELTDNPNFAKFALDQDGMSPDDFYARIAKLTNPKGLDPRQAYEATLDALVEQVETRVTSVANAEAYFNKNPNAVIPMPAGSAIFETIGPWEDYSTPSRDMRLIIAMNVLNGLPEKIVRHPELFVMAGTTPEAAKFQIERYHARRIQERTVSYPRSDGSTWKLSIAEVLARKAAYEMTYNPNDCAEMRWGAQPGSEEYATCRRHAPAGQKAQMEKYRPWFRDARRPTR